MITTTTANIRITLFSEMVCVTYKIYMYCVNIIHCNTLSNTNGIQLFDGIFADAPNASHFMMH